MLSGNGFPDDSDNGERDYSCMIMRVMKNKRMMIVYSIFALYRDTENIHSNMMIWLVIFIISNYSLASSPPKVPGGVKRDIFSESRTLIHRAFSDRKYQNSFPKEWYLYFHSLCTICHKKLCIFLPKRKDD